MADAPCRQTIPVNATTETVSVQYDIEKARADKKRDLRQKQHESYTTAIYGSPAEKEACR